MRIAKVSCVVVVLLLSFTAPIGVAHADHIACGQVITENTTLDSDVGPCPGDGIVIGASGITLDLARHRVLGTGTSVGILAFGHSDVRIANGTVAGFAGGVRVLFGTGVTIEDLVVRDNGTDGIVLGSNFNNEVRRNVIAGNGAAGISTGASGGNVIESNVISRNTGPGVHLGSRSGHFASGLNTVSRNAISENGGDGVLLGGFGVTHTQILGNSISNNGRNGVLVSISRGSAAQCCDLIQGNVVRGNAANGILIQLDQPLFIPLNNRVLGNTAVFNGVFDLADENPGCDNNTWAGNVFGTRNQPCIN